MFRTTAQPLDHGLLCILLALAGCFMILAAASPAETAGLDASAILSAPEVYTAVRSIAAAGELWPGFDPRQVPVMLFDGRDTYLYCHPSPPAGFAAKPGTYGVYIFPGLHDQVRANTMVALNDVWTATVMLPMLRGGTIEQAAVCIHEMFHVYQKLNHESWFANEAELFMYPVADPHLLAMKRMETEMLVRAVSALDEADLVGWAKGAMELRRARFKLMPEGALEYDRHTEGTEGLAHYIQVKANGSLEGVMSRPAGGFAPDKVRQSCYFSGIQIGMALDRLMPDWRERRERQDTLNLDDLLNVALAKRSEPPLSLPGDERLTYEKRAVADIRALQRQQKRVLEDLLKAPGWSVEVLAPAAAPLFPQGFDPMNLCVVDMKHVIHQRYAKVGNAAGQLEILGRTMLTEGQGNHPMFEGMLRALVTGLEKEPALGVKDGGVELSCQGLTVSFTGAELKREGQRITIILPAGSAEAK